MEQENSIKNKLRDLAKQNGQFNARDFSLFAREMTARSIRRFGKDSLEHTRFIAHLNALEKELTMTSTVNKKYAIILCGLLVLLCLYIYLNLGFLSRDGSDVRIVDFTMPVEVKDQPGHVYNFSESGVVFRSFVTDVSSIGSTEAPSIEIDREFERAAIGSIVRVTLTANAPEIDPTDTFRVAYSTARIGNSGWVEFELSAQTSEYFFEYQVADQDYELNGDFIGFWADPLGKGRGVQIKNIKVEAVK